MVADSNIIPLTTKQVPTILSYDLTTERYIIGDDARSLGLAGQTNTFNFKPDLGEGDATFSQKKKYWIVPKLELNEKKKLTTVNTRMLTTKEATMFFLRELLNDVKVPSEIIIGEPAERDSTWKENFRKHMREILGELFGINKPQFLPEPFAVFQYYRHFQHVFSKENESEIVLIIDVGGGTFNSCIIGTTEEGALSRGGPKSVPYGLQAEFCGGSLIDKELLKLVIEKARKQGIRWNDDPMGRAERSTIPVLLHIEDAKINLSNAIGNKAKVAEDFSSIQTIVHLDKGSLHPEKDVHVELSGEDLKAIIRKMWRRNWGEIILNTITEARRKLNFETLDKVLVAGGSSRLPFMLEELQIPLRSLVPTNQIYFGPDRGNAVAVGIACECKEQVRKFPNLSAGNIASCLLNDLFIGFRKSRRDPIELPRKINRPDGSLSRDGQLLTAPFETGDLTLSYKVDLPFDPESRIFYAFSEDPFIDGSDDQSYLNINNDVLSLKPGKKYNRKCELQLDFKKNGIVKPTFIFTTLGRGATPEHIECSEFYIENLRIKEGHEFLGIDFGTSNSYVVRFLCADNEIQASDYPEYKVNKAVMDRLRVLEEEILNCRNTGLLDSSKLQQYAKDKILVNVFHSNKIEGNPLTKGETEQFVVDIDKKPISIQEKEAKNLIDAYNWMIDNVDYLNQDPEGFVRNINKMILEGINAGGGKYRQSAVTISGMNYTPPMHTAVPPLMHSFGEELKKGPDGRSALEYSVAMHTKLVSIHPFVDANGRTARLLLNAILIANNLPVVVINFDDKQRYLDALLNANESDLSALVDFLIECFQQQMDEIKSVEIGEEKNPTKIEVTMVEPAKADPIKDAFIEIGMSMVDDPLKLVMNEQLKEINKIKEAEYDSWKQAFATLLFESRTIMEEFNRDYHSQRFQMQVTEYDMLSFEKYNDILQGKKVSKTWFFSVQIEGPSSHTKVLFFFENIPNIKSFKQNIHKIVLTMVRFDGVNYQRLLSEPITLRSVGFKDGQLIFLNAVGQPIQNTTTLMLKTLFAELIKAYVRIK